MTVCTPLPAFVLSPCPHPASTPSSRSRQPALILTGYDIEVMKAIDEQLPQYKFVFKTMDFSNLLTSSPFSSIKAMFGKSVPVPTMTVCTPLPAFVLSP
jgi:hypothetical protein